MKIFHRKEFNTLSCSLHEGGLSFVLHLLFLESGRGPVEHEIRFQHPDLTFNVIFLFYKGGCRVSTVEGTFDLVPGSLYLLPVNQAFEVTYSEGSVFSYIHFNIHTESGMDIFREIRGVPVIMDAADLCGEIEHWHVSDGIEADVHWQSAIYQAVCRFCQPILNDLVAQSSRTRKYSDLLAYIREHCKPALNVGELARCQHISRSVLSKGFHNDMGMTLKKYLIQMLVQRAKEAVINSHKTIQQIAADLGYDDPYYFYRFFKKHTGQTALEYRKSARLYP